MARRREDTLLQIAQANLDMRLLCSVLIWFCCLSLLAAAADNVPWSQVPPNALDPKTVPQFVAVTFDDNFGLEDRGAVGGVRSILDYYASHRNSDGTPIRTTFFDTTIYMAPPSQTVVGGAKGEDGSGGNLRAWRQAVKDHQEIADHTVNHFNGGPVPISADPCCRARNWSKADWAAEIGAARDMLTTGLGLPPQTLEGFRAPYLGYSDSMFDALTELGFVYDSSLPNCFEPDEDAASCSWPYTLDAQSPDVAALASYDEVGGERPRLFPTLSAHPGLWELPPTTLVVPPDSAARTYRFRPGLRSRLARKSPLPYPGIYDPTTGKIVGMDYTLLVNADLSGDDMRAILEYTLDQHLNGNHSPLVFVAHSHLYAYSGRQNNPDTPSDAVRRARWRGLRQFLDYALSKPSVR